MLELLPAFIDEFAKIAGASAVARVAQHFAQPDWKSFEKNLRSGAFRRAVLKAQESDPKLKKYVKAFGGYVAAKDVVAEITSGSSGKTYKVKDLHNGRWGCNCGDWQFKHSVQGGDCKHIHSVKASRLVKESSPLYAAGVGASYTGWALRSHKKGKQLKANVRALRGPTSDPDHNLPWDERLAKGSL
jgi:hypothetical protein